MYKTKFLQTSLLTLGLLVGVSVDRAHAGGQEGRGFTVHNNTEWDLYVKGSVRAKLQDGSFGRTESEIMIPRRDRGTLDLYYFGKGAICSNEPVWDVWLEAWDIKQQEHPTCRGVNPGQIGFAHDGSGKSLFEALMMIELTITSRVNPHLGSTGPELWFTWKNL